MSEPSEKDSGALRARARDWIEQGRLPRAKAVRTWGGRGSGLRCDLCEATITSDEPEFELQLDPNSTLEPVRLHRVCHAVWNEARQALQPDGWHPVSRELPPHGVVVEARVSLGEHRSIILSVTCLSSPEAAAGTRPGEGSTSAPLWLNETTGGPLPEGWVPIEWRPISPASTVSHTASSSGSPSASDSNAGAAA